MAKASTAVTGKLVIVTGFRELDAKLRNMPAALQRKFVRGGLRKGSKRLVKEIKQIIRAEAHDTGAFEKSIKVKALKRSNKRVGVATYTDTDKLYAEYTRKHGRPPHPMAGETAAFFYPAVLEFGSDTQEPVKPLRKALYDNANIYREYFKADVLQFIAENKVTTALPKVTK